MPKKAKGGPRDALLSVRIPQRVKFGLELMARLNREPMTDAVVRALDDALSSENGGLFVQLPGEDLTSFLLPKVWDERESVRLVKLAMVYPALLSRSEQLTWEVIASEDRFWAKASTKEAKRPKAGQARRQIADLRVEMLAAEWEALTTAVA